VGGRCLDERVSGVSDLASACSHITSSDWYASFRGNATQIGSPEQIELWIQEAADAYTADLDTDDWQRSFAGKELFRHVRGYIYQPPLPASPATYDIDVAKSVARWQVVNDRVPSELSELLAAIQSRI